MLYLQSTPMTEALFVGVAGGAAMGDDLVSRLAIHLGGAGGGGRVECGVAHALRRLVSDSVRRVIFADHGARKAWHAMLFAALAALGPLAWLAHNQYYYSNALEFYNGFCRRSDLRAPTRGRACSVIPAITIGARRSTTTSPRSTLTQGWILVVSAQLGAVAALAKKSVVAAASCCSLPPAFYMWSMHSSGTPIFVPTLWPFSWYNTRYALAALPLAAFAARRIVAMLPQSCRRSPLRSWLFAIAASLGDPAGAPAVCWKESEVNSLARRAWTQQAATTSPRITRPAMESSTPSAILPASCARPAFRCAKGCTQGTARMGRRRRCAPIYFSTKNGRWRSPAISCDACSE